MNQDPAIDPRDYCIIRALGALSLHTPNVELARAFLRDANADERIHLASVSAQCNALLGQGKARRTSDQTVEITFPSCRLASEFEQFIEQGVKA